MKHHGFLSAGLVLAVMMLTPAIVSADVDELDVTMEVLDSVADLDGNVLEMRGPGMNTVIDGPTISEGEEGLPPEMTIEPFDEATEIDFDHDDDFESEEDEDHAEDESDFDEGDDIDLDEYDVEEDIDNEMDADNDV